MCGSVMQLISFKGTEDSRCLVGVSHERSNKKGFNVLAVNVERDEYKSSKVLMSCISRTYISDRASRSYVVVRIDHVRGPCYTCVTDFRHTLPGHDPHIQRAERRYTSKSVKM